MKLPCIYFGIVLFQLYCDVRCRNVLIKNIQCSRPLSFLWENLLFGFTDYPEQVLLFN